MTDRFVTLHRRLLVRQGRGGPSVLRRPAHRLLLRHRPEMLSVSAPQRFRSRHLCLAAAKCLRRSALMYSRPTCGGTLFRSAAGLTRRSSGAPTAGRATAPRYSCFRAAGCRHPLNSTLGVTQLPGDLDEAAIRTDLDRVLRDMRRHPRRSREMHGRKQRKFSA